MSWHFANPPNFVLKATATMSDTENQAGTDVNTEGTAETTASGKPKKPPIVYTTVKMDDDRVVDFAGKRKMLKETLVDAATGKVAVRLDFVNGETRTFTIPDSLLAKCAGHGAEQKLGDEIAGLDDVEDAIMAIDELMERLEKGEWTIKKESNGMAGTSVLAKALMEHSGKAMADIKVFLGKKSHAEKVALRQNAAIAPIVARLEAEKNKTKKPSTVDTEALLGELA